MHPILFRLGPFTLHAFGAMMALAFLAALICLHRLCRGTRRDADYLSSLVVWIMLGGVGGARVAYVCEHWSAEFSGRWGAIIRIDEGGLMFYGGLIGALVALALFARRHREPLLDLLDLVAVALPLGHAIGRIGCLLNGCCHGRVWPRWGGIRFPSGSLAWQEQVDAGLLPAAAARSLPVAPTQLIEAAANALLFVLLFSLFRRQPGRGRVTAAYLIGYGLIRLLVECGRGDPRMSVVGLSIGQVLSVVAVAVGVGLLGVAARLARPRLPPAG